MKLNKIKIIIGVLLVWFIVSIFFLVWFFSAQTKENIFLQGYVAAINDLIIQAENEQCLPFPIFIEDRRVELINIQCLQQVMLEQEIPETP